LLGPAEDDQHLVVLGDGGLGPAALAVHQDVAAVEALCQEAPWLGGESGRQRVEQADRRGALDAPEALGNVAVLVAAGLLGLLERRFEAGVLFRREAGALDDMAEFVDEDAFGLHAALVLHHVFFREEHDLPAFDAREEAALTPIVEVELLAGLVRREHRDVRRQLVVGDDHAQKLLGADARGDVGRDGRHHLVELVGRLAVRVVGHLAGSGDQDALHQRAFAEELRVEFVFGGLFRRQGWHWRQGRRLTAGEEGKQAEGGEVAHLGAG